MLEEHEKNVLPTLRGFIMQVNKPIETAGYCFYEVIVILLLSVAAWCFMQETFHFPSHKIL